MTSAQTDLRYAERVRAGFARQGFMTLIGAKLLEVRPGAVDIVLPLRPELTQQHGFAHAGAAWTIADTAAGFAAQTLMPPETGVLTVELKINLLAPARGERLVARGRVERAGRRLTVARADVVAVVGGIERPVALALGTFIATDVPERDGGGDR